MTLSRFIGGLAMLLAVCLSACSSADHAGQAHAATPPPASPYIAMARGSVDVEGGLIRITAERDGVIKQVNVEDGDSVTAGQILAVMDERQAQIAVGIAQAELDQASAQTKVLQAKLPSARQRAQRLLDAAKEGAATGQAADDAKSEATLLTAEINAAEATAAVAAKHLENARYEAERRTLRAPSAGRIVRRNVHVGDSVLAQSATELFQLLPDRSLIVRAELNEAFVDKVHPDMQAEIVRDGDDSKTYNARVVRIGAIFGPSKHGDDPEARPDERDVECVLLLQDKDLRIGQRVLVRFKH
ncbi:HlyD family efflux transporter periplasmic adaptor subunit [Pseudolysobacter antarcticus]|uniref:HlyD family efflux transporter periplasmic adaptor subunit n=1 Tax=Pseudolysobacter antarcticus TaxID=2511995 RepID=A0A411HM03_9GAMM|nr:HlyD family efflux transporter periplasmic adaptor subunit [Pseudolysobacter antarcticus]QBB71541.1 HlyD family efflux transporter periplasmic adaptor subunit [Pseudolysobacter antarcticus]